MNIKEIPLDKLLKDLNLLELDKAFCEWALVVLETFYSPEEVKDTKARLEERIQRNTKIISVINAELERREHGKVHLGQDAHLPTASGRG